MKVSWDWLKEYVKLDMPLSELETRLAMAGLNHEGTEKIADDLQIDLEVTSNRPDCLGHIGVAREISVLWESDLKIPNPTPSEAAQTASDLARVKIECPELCTRYTARVIQGVKVGPSPDWLAKRLTTLGIAVINNIVDISNYVMLECGQPLHAFDFARIGGQEIIVREAVKDEPFTAIDHREYKLQPGMCVIADSNRPIALGGVMGGADSEVSSSTKDLLIEAADFAPLSIRTTARALRLHSDSSYRFERGVDPEGIDWASRRCCELILDLAGGELASGMIDVHPNPKPAPEPVTLRFSQLKRILGIELDQTHVIDILQRLGLQLKNSDDNSATVLTPSWRRDLPREIDLVEEVARIHGYDEIPEDVGVPMVPSHRTDSDRVLGVVRQVLTSTGFNESFTLSVTNEKLANVFSPWSSAPPIHCGTPMLRGADLLRRSLVPSILAARKTNESLSNDRIELFETAKVYLPSGETLPEEHRLVSLTSGKSFHEVKGVVQQLLNALHVSAPLEIKDSSDPFFAAGQGVELSIGGEVLGYLGTLGKKALKDCGLRLPSTVAEIKLKVLEKHAELVPQHRQLSPYPAINYDFNFIVNESVLWNDIEASVRSGSGDCLESIRYQETYRDTKRDGAGKKRLLLSVVLRSADQTLTGEQADEIRKKIISECESKHQAQLLA